MDVVELWNKVAPDFQIQADDLLQPKQTFFIRAVVKMLTLLDIQIEPLMKWKPSIVTENTEAFVELLPLSHLTKILNFIILEMGSNSKTFTMADLLEPTRTNVEFVFRIIGNLLLFIDGRRQAVAERVQALEEKSQDFMLVMQKKDQVKIQIDKYRLETINIEKRCYQIESEISPSKSCLMEIDKKVNELKMQYDNIIQEKEEIATDLQKEVLIHTSLMEELKSLKSLIITEEDYDDIMSRKTLAIQREKDIENKISELKEIVFKKDVDIKTFKDNINLITEMKTDADNLEEMHKKAREQQQIHINLAQMKREISDLREYDTLLDKMLHEVQEEYNQECDESNRLQTQLDIENEEYFRKEENSREYVKTCEEELKYINLKLENLHSTILEHEKCYENVKENYTNTIPDAYNNLVDDIVDGMEKTMNEKMFEKIV